MRVKHKWTGKHKPWVISRKWKNVSQNSCINPWTQLYFIYFIFKLTFFTSLLHVNFKCRLYTLKGLPRFTGQVAKIAWSELVGKWDTIILAGQGATKLWAVKISGLKKCISSQSEPKILGFSWPQTLISHSFATSWVARIFITSFKILIKDSM